MRDYNILNLGNVDSTYSCDSGHLGIYTSE